MIQQGENSGIVRPTLHHFGVTTRHLDAMVDWYAKVLGMVTMYASAHPWAMMRGATAAFVSNDQANHRIAILSLPDVKDDTDKHAHAKLQHVAFEYATIDDLLNSYERIKGLGIEPILTTDHGPTIAFYYEDPDGNSVEVFVDNFGDWDKSREYVQSSPDFHQNPMGTFVDPDMLVAARRAGMSFAELHRHAYAGEFAPAGRVDPSILL